MGRRALRRVNRTGLASGQNNGYCCQTMTETARPALSVVAPCYNEQEVLPEFVRRVGAVLDRLAGTSEIVLVDDGSSDRTWEVMTAAAARDPRVVAVRLMRNHGHQ